MIELRSYRRVFDLERRVYSVDSVRLNPGGVPVRGVLYLLACFGTALLLGVTPLLGRLVGVVPWYLREVALPAALAVTMTLVRIDGRTFHVAAAAMLRRRLRPRLVFELSRASSVGAVWRPPPIVMLPDGSEQVFRRLRYEGPGAVLVLREHRRDGPVERDGVAVGSSRRRAVRIGACGGAAPAGRAVLVVNRRVRVDVLAERRRA